MDALEQENEDGIVGDLVRIDLSEVIFTVLEHGGDERVFPELSQIRECVGGSEKLHPASSQGSYSNQIRKNPNSTAGIIFFKITSFTHRVTLLQSLLL